MAGYSPALLAAIKKHSQQNNNAAKHFVIAICGLMGLFVIQYWTNVLLYRWRSRRGRTTSKGSIMPRRFRSILLQKIPLFNSVGHFLLFAVYIAINVFLIFWDLDHNQLTNFSRRMGWMTSLNLALLVVLALKNTPLAILTSYSYERLNIFHQLVGYTTVVCICLHAITFLYKYVGTTRVSQLKEIEQIYGMVAAAAMIVTLFTALIIRHLRYELFYVIHVTMFLLIIIMVGMHRPELTSNTLKIIIFTASIWFLDRTLRFLRISYHFLGTTVTITPLPLNAVRLTFSPKTSLFRAQPGSHVFLWIPGVRVAEMHPFTLVGTKPLELVVAAQDGFTRDLRKMAVREPGKRVKASVDGPYGVLPNWGMYDRVLLLAGGSGASFCVGVAVGLVRNASKAEMRPKHVTLVWVVRDHDCLTWFAPELAELSTSPHITIRIHITRAAASPSTPSLTPVTVLTPTLPTITTIALPSPTHATPPSPSKHSTPIITVLTPSPDQPTPKPRSLASTIHIPLLTTPRPDRTSSLSSPISPISRSTTTTLADADTDAFQPHSHAPSHDDEKSPPLFPSPTAARRYRHALSSSTLDLEKSDAFAAETSPVSPGSDVVPSATSAERGGGQGNGLDVRSGRPEIAALVRGFVGVGSLGKARGRARVMVAACGPGGMMGEVRGAVAGVVGGDKGAGVEVEMYLEQFGW